MCDCKTFNCSVELASGIRIVLIERADRIGQALEDERELRETVIPILARKPKATKPSAIERSNTEE